MRNFWDLLADSVIVQGILTLGVVSCVCYLAVTGQPIPDLLTNITGIIVGFWFGSKVTHATHNLLRYKK